MSKNQELAKLILDNPELQILFLADNDDVSIEHNYSVFNKINKCEVDEYTDFIDEEEIILSEDFNERAVNYLKDNKDDDSDVRQEDVNNLLDDLRETGKIKKAIIVYLKD